MNTTDNEIRPRPVPAPDTPRDPSVQAQSTASFEGLTTPTTSIGSEDANKGDQSSVADRRYMPVQLNQVLKVLDLIRSHQDAQRRESEIKENRDILAVGEKSGELSPNGYVDAQFIEHLSESTAVNFTTQEWNRAAEIVVTREKIIERIKAAHAAAQCEIADGRAAREDREIRDALQSQNILERVKTKLADMDRYPARYRHAYGPEGVSVGLFELKVPWRIAPFSSKSKLATGRCDSTFKDRASFVSGVMRPLIVGALPIGVTYLVPVPLALANEALSTALVVGIKTACGIGCLVPGAIFVRRFAENMRSKYESMRQAEIDAVARECIDDIRNSSPSFQELLKGLYQLVDEEGVKLSVDLKSGTLRISVSLKERV